MKEHLLPDFRMEVVKHEQKLYERLYTLATQAWEAVEEEGCNPETISERERRAIYLTELYLIEDARQSLEPDLDEEDFRYWYLYESGLFKSED